MYKPKTMLICKLCGDEIYSHSSGEFRACKCGAIFIDETEYYCRMGKDITNIKERNIDERDFIWTVLGGNEIKIRDLEVSHMKNILIYLEDLMEKNRRYYTLINMENKANKLEYGYMYYAIKNEIILREVIKYV